MFSVCFLLSVSFSLAQQKKQNVYFLKNDNRQVAHRDDADFIRVIQEPDSGETNFVVHEYHKNGEKKTIGKVSAFEPFLVFEGAVITYFDNGSREGIVNYENGRPSGSAYFYFRNGKMKKQFDYLLTDKDDKKPSGLNTMQALNEPEGKLIFFADSLGKVLVKDGNGRAIEISGKADDELVEEGDYLNGLKNGTWFGSYRSGKSSYEESYDAGKFLSGKSVKDSVSYPYTTLSTPPKYKTDVNEFYKYVGKSIRYPKDAIANRISGSVALSFVIDKDGKLTDILILNPLFPSLDDMARRVLIDSPKWQPGIQRGLPVRVKYNFPIKFSLGR